MVVTPAMFETPLSLWEDRGVERGGNLPADWYRSAECLRLELDLVFRHTWQNVGRVEQVANPGDYFVTSIAGEEIVVVRGKDGLLRALSNVCRHRAGPVAVGCGNRKGFQCSYHGWTYSLDGRLNRAPFMEESQGFDRAEFRLPEFRVETWGPLVFVSLDPDVPPIADYLGGITKRAPNYKLDELVYAGGRRWEIPCNWKTYVDNYMEGYHIPFVHPGLNKALAMDVYEYSLHAYYNEQYGAEPHPRGPGSRVAAILGSLQVFRELAPPLPSLEGPERNGYYFFWVFPNLTINLMPDGFLTMSIRPLDVELTESRLEWWFPPAERLDTKLLQAAVAHFGHQVNEEDVEICSHVQKGLRSRLYQQGRYSATNEMCLHHFHRLLSERIQPSIVGSGDGSGAGPVNGQPQEVER